MATSAAPSQIASQARRIYVEELVKNLAGVVQVALEGTRSLIEKPAEHALFMRRRDLFQELQKGAQAWHRAMVNGLRQVAHGATASRPGELPPGRGSGLTLVDDDTIELEIVTCRLALGIMDRAAWESSDLRSRVVTLEGRTELPRRGDHALDEFDGDEWPRRIVNQYRLRAAITHRLTKSQTYTGTHTPSQHTDTHTERKKERERQNPHRTHRKELRGGEEAAHTHPLPTHRHTQRQSHTPSVG